MVVVMMVNLRMGCNTAKVLNMRSKKCFKVNGYVVSVYDFKEMLNDDLD